MNQLRTEERLDQYAAGGRVLARTARALGTPIPSNVERQWERTMIRLAIADDISEESPTSLTDSPEEWLYRLGLDETNPRLKDTVVKLLCAYREGQQARSLAHHLDCRGKEALSSVDLLRFQSPETIRNDVHLWSEIGKLAVIGIYLDSMFDCRKDAQDLPQFSAPQLAVGSLCRAVKTVRQTRSKTLVASFGALHLHKSIPYLIPERYQRLIRST